jgi:hypothetical protein
MYRSLVGAVSATLTTCTALLITATPAAAAPPAGHGIPVTSVVVTSVTDSRGVRLPVVVRRRLAEVNHAAGSYVASVDVAFYAPGTPRSVLDDAALRPWTSGNPGGCWNDSPTYAAEACINQYFTDTESGGRRYAEVTKYTAAFLRLDNQYALSEGSVKAGVFGPCLSGCSFLQTNYQKNWSGPTQGDTYTYVPSWSAYYVAVDGSNFQCGYAITTLTRGTGTLTFDTPDICQGAVW